MVTQPYTFTTEAVTGLFQYVPEFTASADELVIALARAGHSATLSELLPALRHAGLREPRRNVFAPPFTRDIWADLEKPVPSLVFSYFKGGISSKQPYKAITPGQLWKLITGPYLIEKTRQLREQPPGSEARDRIKRSLDYVTPAGTFQPTRANDNLAAASGLLVLDFDHLPDPGVTRQQVLADELVGPAVVLAFISPSGDGLKVLVESDPSVSHQDNFLVVANYLSSTYGPHLAPDKSGKDVARACFACHDATAWLSPRCAA